MCCDVGVIVGMYVEAACTLVSIPYKGTVYFGEADKDYIIIVGEFYD